MTAPSDNHRAPRWDIFCRVVDNFGDAGICWRLARQLAREHAIRPRLWIDVPGTLAAMVPGAAPGAVVEGVRIERWDETDPRLAQPAAGEVADAVLSTFGCTLPEGYRRAMRTRRPVWVDYEHLSAEAWVATHHGLTSPKPDGLVQHWFMPGFEAGTGGLPREAGLLAERDAFVADATARAAFLETIGVTTQPGERLASLFCYPDAPARALLDALAARAARGERWRVLVPEGVAPQVGGHPLAVPVPFLPQPAYDRLLWSCDLNLVRGEDSVVRAMWAARPFLWQAYRQADAAHLDKVRALVDAWTRRAAPDPALVTALHRLHEAWNADPGAPGRDALVDRLQPCIDRLDALAQAARRWSDDAGAERDAVGRLVDFIIDRL